MEIIKEQEARMKICPILCQNSKDKQHCITEYCMSWKRTKDTSDEKYKDLTGYCILLSK